MMGANAMNNMLVNSSHKPIMHPGVPADPNAQTGCLGMSAGGSADPVAAGKGKGGGKGRGNGAFPKFGKPPKKERKALLVSQVYNDILSKLPALFTRHPS